MELTKIKVVSDIYMSLGHESSHSLDEETSKSISNKSELNYRFNADTITFGDGLSKQALDFYEIYIAGHVVTGQNYPITKKIEILTRQQTVYIPQSHYKT